MFVQFFYRTCVLRTKLHTWTIEHFLKYSKINMPRLSQAHRDQAIGMLVAGLSKVEVARRFGCTKAAIYRLERWFQLTGRTQDRPRCAAPRVTTPRQDRRIRLQHLRDRFRKATRNAAETQGRHNNIISAKTVIRRLRENGLRARRAHVGMVLDARRRSNRLNWGNNHRHGA